MRSFTSIRMTDSGRMEFCRVSRVHRLGGILMTTMTTNTRGQTEFEKKFCERFYKLPKKTKNDLIELFSLLASEESDHERNEIAKTIWEIIYPESLMGVESNDGEEDVA